MMEPDDAENPDNQATGSTYDLDDQDSRSAVNSLILDYYKKFGRNRDLEQYFSLSTAQSEIRDPSSLFWRRLKMQQESSDSGDKPSESSSEFCRISIQCTIPVDSSSQDEKSNSKIKSDSESPPIITEEAVDHSVQSDNESVKSEDKHSQKSVDLTLDTSMNKLASPTSSITSQRRLEWDSLADVGYANESERKTSGSSLSTLERLALLQQYSNNDNKSNDLGPPTAHSTMIDPSTKTKANKKSLIKKTREFHSKDVNVVEFNAPQSSTETPHSINVNLTKHISFNIEKNGAISMENVDKDFKVESSEKAPSVTDNAPELKFDKEIQTSLTKLNNDSKDKHKSKRGPKTHYAPVFISLNTLRKRLRKRYTRTARKKPQRNLSRKHERSTIHEKSGEQVSEAESFEYMPGHIYNQNQLIDEHQKSRSSVGNKSSLESSGITTESSKSNISFTRDLDDSVKLLDAVLKRHKDNASLKNKLVKDIVKKLVKSRYKDDESTTDFLSGLSYSSKRLGLGEDTNQYTTTSTSDANNSGEKNNRPRKSILRVDKLKANAIPSTSQSTPNLPAVSNSEIPIVSKYLNPLVSSCTESDISSKAKDSSDTDGKHKTSSEELYQKYLDAVKREDAYKKHLRDKERFMREKLLGSDNIKPFLSKPIKPENNRLSDLMKDLTSNNFDNGSGDASKAEKDIDKFMDVRKLRSHSVFTLSSGNTDKCGNIKDKERETRKLNLRKRLQEEIEASCSSAQGSNQQHNCCCPQHAGKCINIGDGKVQLKIHGLMDENTKINKCTMQTADCNIEKSKPSHIVQDNATGDIKYVYCVCSGKGNIPVSEVSDNFMVYKCSRLINKGVQLEGTPSNASNDVSVQCCDPVSCKRSTSPCNKQFKNKDVPCSKATIEIHPTGSLKICNDHHDKQNEKRRFSEASRTNIGLGQISSDRNSPRKETVAFSVSCKEELDACASSERKYVLDITRCVQTEISINPNIPEPSLSDVKMLYDNVCTKVSENYRKVEPKSTSKENNFNSCQENCETQMTPRKDIFCNLPREKTDQACGTRQTEETFAFRHIATQSNICLDEINCGVPCQTIPSNIDNYTIPLQGTNMTLMVSISAKDSNLPTTDNKLFVCENQQTNPEKGTCLAEECSIGVQYEAAIMEDDNQVNSCCQSPKDIDTNKLNVHFDSETDMYKKNTDTVNTCFGNPSFKSTTYPKVDKTPARRSNNDAVLLRRVSDDQILYTAKPLELKTPQCLGTVKKDIKGVFCNDQSNNATCASSSSGKPSKLDDFISSEEQLRSTLYQSSRHRSTYESVISSNDPILDTIRNITNRYTKTPNEKGKRKKCFKEIMQVLKFLLETEETADTCLPSSGNDTPRGTKDTKDSCTGDCKCGCIQELSVICEKHTIIKGNDVHKCRKADDSSKNISPPPRAKDQKHSCTSLKSDSEFKSSQEDPDCKCGCGGRGECKRESTPTTAKPIIKLRNHSPCKVERRVKDLGGQGECKRKPSPQRKPALSPCRDSPRSKSPSPKRYDVCDCGCGGKNECKQKRMLVSKPTAKTRKDFSSPSGSNKSTPRDFGGQGECMKSTKSKDVKPSGECQHCSCGGKNRCKDKCEVAMAKYGRNKKDASCGVEQDMKPSLKKSSSRCKSCGASHIKDRKGSHTSCKKEHLVKSCGKECECGCGGKENCNRKTKKDFRPSSSETDRTTKTHLRSSEKKVNEKACQCGCDSTDCNKTKCMSKTTAYFPAVLSKKITDKCIQQSCNEDYESTACSDSPLPCSSHHDTSDAFTCEILNKIKNECERYHQTRCRVCKQKYVESSTTSDNYKGCQRNHFCSNKILQKCRTPKQKLECDKYQKKCVAYNLLLQTSESLANEDGQCFRKQRQLQNVVMKVPSKRANMCRGPFDANPAFVEEPSCSRAGRQAPRTHPCRMNRSSSWPNESEVSSTDDYKRAQAMSCKDYLERNRPDFIENASARLNCLKIINETRANERDAKRKLLSLQLERGAKLSSISATDLRHLAKELGLHNFKRKKLSPKFISEREMKKHSENIYKSLPEVMQKKEDLKKENIKKTNLLMANIFKKNLQRKTLQGSVNLSNYSAVIKI